MAESAEIKTITVQGGAVDAYKLLRGMKSKGRRGTRKARQEGGDEIVDDEGYVAPRRNQRMTMRKMDGGAEVPSSLPSPASVVTTPGTMTPNTKVMGPLPALTAANEAGTLPNTPSLTPNPTATASLEKLASTPPSSQTGGKLILAPKKTRGKLLLAPPSKKGRTNRGCTRKIRVQLSNMKKRLTTAKVIHRDSKEKSIAEIRKLLEEAKLVKPAKEGKSVPEDILRNIYKDYLILRNKAL